MSSVADRALAAFFAFALWGNVAVDVWMGLDIDLRSTGFAFHQTVYAQGRDFDPLFIANSPYFRWSAFGTALLFAPYYILAIPSLASGRGLGAQGTLIRRLSWVYGAGMFVNMSVVLVLELVELAAGSELAPALGPYWIPCGLYWVVPLVVLLRLVREDNAVGEKVD